jgi:GNAT superfamily N-acetyltransferase
MPAESEITVEAVASVPWEDVSLVFGTRGDPWRCWCQYFKLPNREFETATPEACAGMLREQVQASSPGPGVIAYLGAEPVGWCAVEPKPAYSRLHRAKVVTEGSRQKPDDASVWAVTCFVVRVGYRRRGVAAALLRGAVAQARGAGARVVEGYPVDVALRPKAPSAELYHGTASLFAAAGFVNVARVRADRAVMELVVG